MRRIGFHYSHERDGSLANSRTATFKTHTDVLNRKEAFLTSLPCTPTESKVIPAFVAIGMIEFCLRTAFKEYLFNKNGIIKYVTF